MVFLCLVELLSSLHFRQDAWSILAGERYGACIMYMYLVIFYFLVAN